MNDTPKALSDYLSKIGKKGGKAKSKAKTLAARLNASKPRKRKRTK